MQGRAVWEQRLHHRAAPAVRRGLGKVPVPVPIVLAERRQCRGRCAVAMILVLVLVLFLVLFLPRTYVWVYYYVSHVCGGGQWGVQLRPFVACTQTMAQRTVVSWYMLSATAGAADDVDNALAYAVSSSPAMLSTSWVCLILGLQTGTGTACAQVSCARCSAPVP